MDDLALLVIRLVVGTLVAGHGAQKLFGWFGGGGLSGTSTFLASTGLRPARAWAVLGGVTELGGGLLTMLGLLYPLAPIGVLSAMIVAIATVHWHTPIWADEGGAELPITNAAIATALILSGPGGYALDLSLSSVLLQFFAFLTIPTLVVSALVIALALVTRNRARSFGANDAGSDSSPQHAL